MKTEKAKLILKAFKIKPEQQEMLEEMVTKFGIISESEAIRQAISFWYRKMEPEYLKPSPKQQKQIEEERARKRMEDMSPEDYALDVLNARILKADDGKEYAVTMTIANTVKIWPLEQVKEIDAADSFFRETHLKMLADGVDFDLYLERAKYKLSRVGITYPETQNENKNTNEWDNNQKAQEAQTTIGP